ncbi:MAG: hypothetical protein IJJ51_01920, partial [Kiritimatiellae bacterium]|nr:hypothetical protein [Kiritimatiellia bacterium]
MAATISDSRTLAGTGRGRECEDKTALRKNRLAANTLAIWGRSVAAMLLGLFSSRWIFQSLGAETLGLYYALAALMSFAGMVGGVLQLSMTRSLSIALGGAAGGESASERETAEVMRGSVLLALCFAAALLCVAMPLGEASVAHRISAPEGFGGIARLAWRLMVAGTALGAAGMPAAALLAARQRFFPLSAIGLGQSAGYFLLAWTMCFALAGLGRERLLAVFVAGNTAIGLAAALATILVAR